MQMIMMSLENSDGCSVIGPSWIQRWAPRADVPTKHEQVDDVQGLGVFLQLRIIEAAEKEDDHQVDDKSRPLFCDEVVVDGPFIDMRRTADDAQADADDEEAHDEHDFI